MKAHAFVAMPFGRKKAADGTCIDFNVIYNNLLKPAIEAAGLEAFRADEEQTAGDIKADMFQELLIADLVLVDLTLDNANVWYELGVRHALRARGIVLVQGPRQTQPFDIYTDRKYVYGLKNGLPDPATHDQDIKAISQMVQATQESWHGQKISPVYQLLPNLQEPQWKALKLGAATQFWQTHEAWENRIDLARKNGHIGDLLVLADEAPVSAFRAEARIKAGTALRQAECFDFALEQLDQGLLVDEENLTGQREKGICLQRLALQNAPGFSLDKARHHYRKLLENHPNDPETWALLARVDKDAWGKTWRIDDWTSQQKREEAAYQDALLRAAIESYKQAFRHSPGHYYSGINALTLMHLYRHLCGDQRYSKETEILVGAVRFAAQCEADEAQRFWAKATLGDLLILTGSPESITEAYKEAIVYAEKDWFALNSTMAQLQLLQELGFRPDCVQAGLDVFEHALQRLTRPKQQWQPRKVFLFSGHMIDQPGRNPSRFPQEKEADAATMISNQLAKLDANAEDLALTQGACGGDILFAEACIQSGLKVRLMQPFIETEFIQRSVVPSDESWRARYFDIKKRLEAPPRAAPIELGPPPGWVNPYERCNLWLLNTALAYGIDKVQFICLWNGGGGDSPGGTAHMYQEVKRRTGQVHWLDTRTWE